MRLWAWLHLPSALAATSTKTVVVAGLLVGMTTTATAGVVVLGSSAVRMPATQGQQTVPHLGATGPLDRTPVVVVPPIHLPATATPHPTVPAPPPTAVTTPATGNTTSATGNTASATPAGSQPADLTVVPIALPTAPTVPSPPPSQAPHTPPSPPTAPTANVPATVQARPAATSAHPTPTPARAPTTHPTPAATPKPAATTTPSHCGTITDSESEQAVTAQSNCGAKKSERDDSADHSDNDIDDQSDHGDNGRHNGNGGDSAGDHSHDHSHDH